MGHHKKSMNTSCDITWRQMILHAVTRLCFVSHYTNAFFFFSQSRFFLHPVDLKSASTCTQIVEELFLPSFTLKSASIHLSVSTSTSLMIKPFQTFQEMNTQKERRCNFCLLILIGPKACCKYLWWYDMLGLEGRIKLPNYVYTMRVFVCRRRDFSEVAINYKLFAFNVFENAPIHFLAKSWMGRLIPLSCLFDKYEASPSSQLA